MKTSTSGTRIESFFGLVWTVTLRPLVVFFLLCYFMVLQFAIPLRSHASADERLELAAKTLSSYIQEKRTDPDLYMVRGLLYEKIGRFEQSLADLQTAKALYLTAKATVRVTIAMCAIDELKLRMRKQNAQ